MKKLIFTNQKGGVGKTTLTREIGICLSIMGKRILLIDSDPQGNLTKSLTETIGKGLYEAFEESFVEPLEIRENLFLLSGDQRLAALEKRYLGEVDAYGKLSSLFENQIFYSYDLILIDSPPSLGVMTLNGLAAADCFVIPLRPALYSLQGTNDLLSSVAKVKKSLNPGLELLGVMINDYLAGPVISKQIKAEILESFGDKVFSMIISRTIKVEEAIASLKGVVEDPSKIGFEIETLSSQLLERLSI